MSSLYFQRKNIHTFLELNYTVLLLRKSPNLHPVPQSTKNIKNVFSTNSYKEYASYKIILEKNKFCSSPQNIPNITLQESWDA